jgi:hypothetical protein
VNFGVDFRKMNHKIRENYDTSQYHSFVLLIPDYFLAIKNQLFPLKLVKNRLFSNRGS